MRRRFLVEQFEGSSAVLRGEAAHHLGHVLRGEPGQLYELSDGKQLWLGRINRVRRDAVEFSLVEPLPIRQTHLNVILLLAIVKFDRFEWSLEKATELGVAEIIPLAAARSEKTLVAAAAKRAARWRKILLESGQQARRLGPPLLQPTARCGEAFVYAHAQSKIILSERPDAPALKVVLKAERATSAVLAIGPEGGWADDELAAARKACFMEASLGANILRTETAALAALAILNYALGD